MEAAGVGEEMRGREKGQLHMEASGVGEERRESGEEYKKGGRRLGEETDHHLPPSLPHVSPF